ncbi:MAG: hypothetical protein U9Q62_09480 [Campylobacterota bacterium]|nr:hypothetical protein [Campylobacterota bacterium]
MSEALKEKVLKAQTEGDIAGLYVLEQEAHETFDEKTLSAYYSNILDLALENLTDALEAARRMDMTEVQDFATVRALYEYAIEHYSAGKAIDAAALFEVLSGLTNDEPFSRSMLLHLGAARSGLSLEDFINTIADIEETQNAGTFYISSFKEAAQTLLDNLDQDNV